MTLEDGFSSKPMFSPVPAKNERARRCRRKSHAFGTMLRFRSPKAGYGDGVDDLTGLGRRQALVTLWKTDDEYNTTRRFKAPALRPRHSLAVIQEERHDCVAGKAICFQFRHILTCRTVGVCEIVAVTSGRHV